MIPKKNLQPLKGYKQIHLKNIENQSISLENKRYINEFIKIYNQKIKIYIVFPLFIGILFPILSIFHENITIFVISFACILCSLIECKNLIPKKSQCTHCQIGYINELWSNLTTMTNSDNNLYFDVLFHDTKTRYIYVQCSELDKFRAEKGDKILVIAFDDINAYGILLK